LRQAFGFIRNESLITLDGERPILIRVYDEAGNVIVTHESAGDFREW
jgi:hypothetical protein